MIYKARGRESQESRREKERIYAIKQHLHYQLVLYEAGCDVLGLIHGQRVGTEVERKAGPQIKRNIRRDFRLGLDLLVIACRTQNLLQWIREKVLPAFPEFKERIRLVTFAELQRGHVDVFKIEPSLNSNSQNTPHE